MDWVACRLLYSIPRSRLILGLNVENATLNRFLSLHYLLPFIIAGNSVVHLAADALSIRGCMVAGMWTNPSLPAVRMFGPDLRPSPAHAGVNRTRS